MGSHALARSAELFLKGMQELLRVLRPDGIILMTMPTETYYLKRYSLKSPKAPISLPNENTQGLHFLLAEFVHIKAHF